MFPGHTFNTLYRLVAWRSW